MPGSGKPGVTPLWSHPARPRGFKPMAPHCGNRSSASVLGREQEGSGMLCGVRSWAVSHRIGPAAPHSHQPQDRGGTRPGRQRARASSATAGCKQGRAILVRHTPGALRLVIVSFTWCRMNWTEPKNPRCCVMKLYNDSGSCVGFILI